MNWIQITIIIQKCTNIAVRSKGLQSIKTFKKKFVTKEALLTFTTLCSKWCQNSFHAAQSKCSHLKKMDLICLKFGMLSLTKKQFLKASTLICSQSRDSLIVSLSLSQGLKSKYQLGTLITWRTLFSMKRRIFTQLFKYLLRQRKTISLLKDLISLMRFS